ncbi:MAG: L,D-transpeptidase family protein [Planctomycetaceae bacterium]
MAPFFASAELAYPPARFALVGLKSEKRLELYAADPEGPFKFIKLYPVLAASGRLGPKLKEGDRQVPEGLYRIESLNPNSRYHLALRLDYPNADDRQQASADGRTGIGSDIMIHGRDASIGCLAMGDPAAEELFVLAADVGWSEAQVVLAPVDLRRTELPPDLVRTAWAESLYAKVKSALSQYPIPAAERLPN